MNIQNIGYRSDGIVREFDGSIVEKDGYFVIRMPTNPTFHWGNLLLFRSAPLPGDFDIWTAAYEQEFGCDAGHMTFGWDASEAGDTTEFQKNGFSVEVDSVLCFESAGPTVKSDCDLEIRKINGDDDWNAVLKLQLWADGNDPASEAYAEFKMRLFKTYRRMSEADRGNWWGAFSGEVLVGDMGLYFDPRFELGRFQSVETHPDYWRRGICSRLLRFVLEDAASTAPNARIVICANSGSDAERLYIKAGFRQRDFQYGVSLPCPFANRFEHMKKAAHP